MQAEAPRRFSTLPSVKRDRSKSPRSSIAVSANCRLPLCLKRSVEGISDTMLMLQLKVCHGATRETNSSGRRLRREIGGSIVVESIGVNESHVLT